MPRYKKVARYSQAVEGYLRKTNSQILSCVEFLCLIGSAGVTV